MFYPYNRKYLGIIDVNLLIEKKLHKTDFFFSWLAILIET